LVSARFCDAEENADGRLLVSARFCDSCANGRITFFAIDVCNSYANGRIDFVGIGVQCELNIRDNMAQYGPYKIKRGEKNKL